MKKSICFLFVSFLMVATCTNCTKPNDNPTSGIPMTINSLADLNGQWVFDSVKFGTIFNPYVAYIKCGAAVLSQFSIPLPSFNFDTKAGTCVMSDKCGGTKTYLVTGGINKLLFQDSQTKDVVYGFYIYYVKPTLRLTYTTYGNNSVGSFDVDIYVKKL
jgi:hypothetical protein